MHSLLDIFESREQMKEDGDSEGYRDREFTSIWEMWILLVAPYFIFVAGGVAIAYTPSFCLGA